MAAAALASSTLFANVSSILQPVEPAARFFCYDSLMLWLPATPIKPRMPYYSVSKRKAWSCNAHVVPYPDYDPYELLGVDNTASEREIRRSYRWLQKKCHPDVAGAVGHDMSILLNQAYSTLSDPHRRAAYDQLRGGLAELDGFTGQPLYSTWFGPANESKAVFVDESQCVGCLKCALIASNTFAIETRYGRARAVGQWADPEPIIEDAIKACPVDCISWVDRSKLAALEFVMSKQPRFHVGIDAHNNGGLRIVNVCEAADKLLEKKRLQEEENASQFQETPAQRNARLAAMDAVQARAGRWWYHFIGKKMREDGKNLKIWDSNSARASQGAIVPLRYFEAASRTTNPINNPDAKVDVNDGHGQGGPLPDELEHLFEAATRRRHAGRGIPSARPAMEEYWVPLEPISCSVSFFDEDTGSKPGLETRMRKHSYMLGWVDNLSMGEKTNMRVKGMFSSFPMLVSAVAALLVGITGGTDAALSETETLGPLPLELTNSIGLQAFLAAAVWYMIGTAISSSVMLALTLYHVAVGKDKPTS